MHSPKVNHTKLFFFGNFFFGNNKIIAIFVHKINEL